MRIALSVALSAFAVAVMAATAMADAATVEKLKRWEIETFRFMAASFLEV